MHALFLAPVLLLSSLSSSQQPRAAAQHGTLAQDEDTIVPTVFYGFVLELNGTPAEGAVVVSSAGGKAVTDHAGSFRLEVGVPLGAKSVQVTAVGRQGKNLVASSSVSLTPASAPVWVGPLLLSSGSCSPLSWLPTFGGQPGTDRVVRALCVFDDGGGPALYAGGDFEIAGGVVASGIAKWNGSSWSAVGSAQYGQFGDVHALLVFDDGGGPALYAGGSFFSSSIRKWNGSSWSAPGSGVNGTVRALSVFDDGGGPALYAGGDIFTAGGVPANRIAKWNGSSWSALGIGLNDVVNALTVFDDGGGPALYAGGSFTTAGGVAANNIAKWNGSSWSALGSGVTWGNGVNALSVFDDGGGPALYAGGDFEVTIDSGDSFLAKWGCGARGVPWR